MIIANIFCAASSVVGDYLAGSGIEGIHFLQYLIYTIYFFFHSTLSILFALYIMNVTGTGIKWKRTSYFFFSIPYIVSEVLVLINGFNDWTFTIDDNLFYHRGPLMYLLYGLGVFYVIIGVIFFIKNTIIIITIIYIISKCNNITVFFLSIKFFKFYNNKLFTFN